MATQLPAPTPTERAWYNTSTNRIRRAYDMGSAQNRYDRGLAGTKYQWDRADLLQQIQRQRNAQAAPFNRRGMLNSGIYQADRARNLADQLKALTRLQYGDTQRTAGFDMTDKQLKNVREGGLADVLEQYNALREARNEASVTAGLGS